MGKRKNWDKKQMNEIIKQYQNGESTINLGRKYQVSCVSIYNIVKKSGIQMRTPSQAKQEYNLNENYFDDS